MRCIRFLALTVLLATTVVAAEDLDPRFAFLKTLEGTWETASDQQDGHGGIFEYRITAGGSAVEERLMAGSPMEMLTVYHMNGKDLVATHYCMLGNQPRLTAGKKMRDGVLEFECDGKVSNAGSHGDQHIHAFSMQLTDDGRLQFNAAAHKDGEVVETPSFLLSRR